MEALQTFIDLVPSVAAAAACFGIGLESEALFTVCVIIIAYLASAPLVMVLGILPLGFDRALRTIDRIAEDEGWAKARQQPVGCSPLFLSKE